jgi:hypothetical protein
MRVREAKDFLLAQTAEQASLEGVPLADLEKRMMYFTEGAGATEDPTTLNEAFETQYDRAKYEKKISHLMHHAYTRVRGRGGPVLQTWDDAIRRVKREDHYLLVMWGQRPGIHGAELIGLAIGIFLLAALLGLRWIVSRFHPTSPRLIQAVFLVVILAVFFFPRRVGNAVGWLLDQTFFRFFGPKEDEKDTE